MLPNVRSVLAPAMILAGLLPTNRSALAQGAAGTGGSSFSAPSTSASPGNAGSASGISSNPGNNTTGDLSLQAPPLPNSGPPLSGLFPGVGQTLLDDGIDFHGLAVDRFLANPTAGSITGQTYNLSFLAPAVDLDLGKIAGITGGNVHIQVTIFGLRSDVPNIITDTGGFLTGYQTTPDPDTATVALTSLTYEQKFLGDRLSVEVGRTNPYHYFVLSNGLDIFTDASSTLNVDGDLSAYPFPSWGGRATYHITPTWYLQGGAFEDSYYRSVYNPDNFGIGGAQGAQIIGEVGYRSEFNTADYPSNFELGAEWNTRTGVSYGVSNVKGGALLATPMNEATDYAGGGVLFFQGQQVFWRGAKSPYGPPANIALYGSLDASVDKPQPIDMDAIAGVNFTGLIPGRMFNALGIQAHYQRLSAIEANYETLIQNIFAGPGPKQSRNGFAFELVGNFAPVPWLRLNPTVQYYVHPDNLYDPAQPRRPSDGFEAGVFAIIPLGPLLGSSNKPF